ncbi:MAG: pteridine reductase [Motiliproteus sp.]
MIDDSSVVLITGAARRIGASIARSLHGQGYRVLIHYRHSKTEAQSLALQLNQIRPDSARLLQAELDSVEAVEQLAVAAEQSWGRINALVNNASGFSATTIGEVKEQQWDELMASNLKAPFFLSQALATTLAANQGAIVNIVDIHSLRPLQGFPVYSTAKAGLRMLTQALAKELAPNIRVNGVAPGLILWPEGGAEQSAADKQTLLNKTPLKRAGQPEDIANAVSFLLQQPYITGQILAVDGGKSLYS